MKWSELTWKERKQIYDTVRADNPNASYLDIKQQFDNIPEYENGKDQDAQAWKINETVRLGLEGRGVSQDSLQHIIDRANMQNPVKSYDPLAGSNEHLANLLEGLNKTVGTAATGASVLTMGLWNALRMLKLPKAEMLKLVRQGLAKQARTGQNIGNYADYATVAEDLLRNEFDVNNIGQIVINQVAGKDLTKTRNKVGNLIGSALDTNDIVTSVAPSYENGKEHEVAASYSLPEINIYPQNQFGDIARSQGYNTAKAWKEVKEGTTSGINAFANDPRTQFVTGVLPLPSGIEGISEVGNLLKTSKRIENKFQKNIGNYVSNFLKETSLNSLLGNSFSARRKYLTEAYNAANAAVHDVKIINNVADKNYRKYMLDNNKTIYFTEDFDKNSKIPIKIHGKNSNKLFEKNVSGVYDPDKQRIDLRGLNGSYIKYRTPPSVIRANAAHEIQHWAENYIADGDVSKWDGFSKYYVPNEDNWIGNAFKKVLSGKPGDWIYSPAEVLAERAALMDKYRMPISTNKNATDFLLRRFEISAKNKNGFLNLLNQLDSMQFPDGEFKVKKTINKVNQKTPAFENGKEGNLKLPIEYAVPLTIADLANANNTNNN